MNLNEFAKEIHENAVTHGWWPEGRTDAEVVSLVHSEWSEALEAYRNNEPMRWYTCTMEQEEAKCEQTSCPFYHQGKPTGWWDVDHCEAMKAKPEGVAVELVDGCIRVLDAAAAWGIEVYDGGRFSEKARELIMELPLANLVCMLHDKTGDLWVPGREAEDEITMGYDMASIVQIVQMWLKARDVDFEKVMVEKHEYNKTRPYRHGGKKI